MDEEDNKQQEKQAQHRKKKKSKASKFIAEVLVKAVAIRANIECAFSRFVHRWSILRAPMPMNITVPKTTAIVIAMAKLHNYCIDESDVADDAVPRERFNMEMNGIALLASDDANADVALPRGLLDGGQHFGDMPENARKQRERHVSEALLPRTLLHQQIVDSSLTRPIPARSRH